MLYALPCFILINYICIWTNFYLHNYKIFCLFLDNFNTYVVDQCNNVISLLLIVSLISASLTKGFAYHYRKDLGF